MSTYYTLGLEVSVGVGHGGQLVEDLLGDGHSWRGNHVELLLDDKTLFKQ